MKVLIAEDDGDIAITYKIALKARNHEVELAKDGDECLSKYNYALKDTKQSPNEGSPFDAVILDYRMPKKDDMEVAKKVLSLNPHQRIIFASAYVKETLVESVKQLKQVVELIQKPFELSALIDTIEDKEIFAGLEKLNVKLHFTSKNVYNLTHEQIRDLYEGLRMVQKGRTF